MVREPQKEKVLQWHSMSKKVSGLQNQSVFCLSGFTNASHHSIRQIKLSLHYSSTFKPELQILTV